MQQEGKQVDQFALWYEEGKVCTQARSQAL
jgi:hypothetical protein